ERIPGKISVDDVATGAVWPESEADTPEQVRHLRSLQVIDLYDMESALRANLLPPHPLGDLVGVRRWLGEENMERTREHVLHAFVRQHVVVLVGVGEHDDWEVAGVLDEF